MPELPEVEHVKRGIEPFIKSAKIEKVTFAKNVINGKNNNRETIIKGMELDTFKKLTEGYVIKKLKEEVSTLFFI
ncbi:DNA-formamidopyrimidine glycosylase [Staphylococcus epidermidis SK135]|nr:DNA-formamidopyrimidine glycosylase [Staphylococcus epidermidis SK135]